MSSSVYYFLEDFNPALSYQEGTVVPLNPFPLFELGRRNIPYQIMESFYSEKELRANEPEFFIDELAWIDRWDTFLSHRVEFASLHNLRLTRMYYNRIKYFVNALIIQAKILDKMVQTVGRDGKVIYIKRKVASSTRQTMHDFKYDESSLCFEALLPAICAKHGVLYVFDYFTEITQEDQNRNFAAKSKTSSGAIETAKKAYHFYKFKKWHRLLGLSKSMTDLNVFFVHSGSAFLDPVIKNFIMRGANVFTRMDNAIVHLSASAEPKVFELNSGDTDDIDRKIRADCFTAAQDIETSAEGKELIAWVTQKCGIDISGFVTPYLKAFVAESCPELLLSARRYDKFYSAYSIDYIFSHTNADHASKSAIFGAQIHGKTETACLQHCCDPFIDRIMHLTEIDAFDYYFTTDDMSEKKFLAYNQAPYITPSKVFQSPHYLQLVRSRAFTKDKKAGEYKRVLYIPTKLAAVHTRCYNCMTYPILWYLEFQKDLFAHFAKHPEIEFIYKQPMIRTKFVKESVLPYLSEKNYPNIRVETKPVMDCFKEADAVIMDRPTTAFFEALMSGLPVLALYPDFVSNMYDPESFKLFGKSFQSFISSAEAASKINRFLKADRKDYIPTLGLTDHDAVKILSIAKKSNVDALAGAC